MKIETRISLFLMLFLVGCATANINISSNPPGAKIKVTPVSGGTGKVIGETPFKKTGDEFIREVGGSSMLYISLEKEGYANSEFLITEIAQNDLNISRDLQTKKSACSITDNENPLERLDALNGIIDKIFNAQRLTRVGELKQAEDELKKVVEVEKTLSAPYEMLGGLYYLRKDYNAALDSYRLALRINANNVEALKMKALLEEILGTQGGKSK